MEKYRTRLEVEIEIEADSAEEACQRLRSMILSGEEVLRIHAEGPEAPAYSIENESLPEMATLALDVGEEIQSRIGGGRN